MEKVEELCIILRHLMILKHGELQFQTSWLKKGAPCFFLPIQNRGKVTGQHILADAFDLNAD
jgi:hypothetical protein